MKPPGSGAPPVGGDAERDELADLPNTVPVLALSRELHLCQFNRSARLRMGLDAADVGRPLRDIDLNLDDNLEPLLREVLETLAPREVVVHDRDRRRYVLRVHPRRTAGDHVEGVLMMLTDPDPDNKGEASGRVEEGVRKLGETTEELRALAASLLASREEERRRIARALHDDVGQRLALLDIDAQLLEPQIATDPAQAQRNLQPILTAIRLLSDDLRNMSRTVFPTMIDDLGLSPALRSLVEDFREREGMKVSYSAQHVPEDLPAEIAIGLYRIAEEALRMVAGSGGKTQVTVALSGTDSGIRLEASDSGGGFDTGQWRAGIGRIAMEERVRLMKGTLEITDDSRITVDVPLTGG